MTHRAWIGTLVLLGAALSLPAALARGQERDEEQRVSLMGQPAEFTDVIDAFDGDDPFDLNLSIGYERSLTRALIERENADEMGASMGRSTATLERVARYTQIQNRLVLGVDIGVFHDLAAYLRFPLILSDTRQLGFPEDANGDHFDHDAINTSLGTLAADGSIGPPYVFQLPFTSPDRSGIDWFAAGARWGIFNQYRDRWMPTWVLGLEGRFAIGTRLSACEHTSSGDRCDGGGTDPGISRGMNGLRFYTLMSRRFGDYIEPYWGLTFQLEWPKRGTYFSFFDNIDGIINNMPPIFGELTAGFEIVPWENRETWQRFSIDLRATGAYHSEGHDYSPLFDALGSSTHPGLTAEQTDGTDHLVHFGGLTDTQAYGSFGGRLALSIQAARYVRFSFGTGITYDAAHFITYADACNPDFSPSTDTDPRAGGCRNGIINPDHRPVIDLAGRRFRLNESTTFDVFVNGTAMF